MPDKLVFTAGRAVFGTAVSAFGVLCLYYLDFVSSLQPVPATLPGYRVLAVLTGIVLLSAGVGVIGRSKTGAAATVLIVLFASWVVLLHIPSAFLEPRLLRSPWWIRTFETLAFIGASVILLASTQRPVAARWQRVGRLLYGGALPVFGVLHLVYPASVAALVPPWYPFPMFWAYFTGFAQVGAGLAIVGGVSTRLAALLAGTMYGLWGLTLHIPRSWCQVFGSCSFLPGAIGPGGLRPGLTSLFVAFAMCGAAWIVAGSHVREWTVPEERDT